MLVIANNLLCTANFWNLLSPLSAHYRPQYSKVSQPKCAFTCWNRNQTGIKQETGINLLLLYPKLLLRWIPLTFTWNGNNKAHKWSPQIAFSESKCWDWWLSLNLDWWCSKKLYSLQLQWLDGLVQALVHLVSLALVSDCNEVEMLQRYLATTILAEACARGSQWRQHGIHRRSCKTTC